LPQANEVGTREGPEPNQVALALCEEVDCLGPAAADRLDQASRFSQLLSKRSHRVREGGGHENCLERGLVRKSLRPVADDDFHVLHTLSGEVGAGGLCDVGPALDAPHEAAKTSEQRGLEAVSSSDFKHLLRAAERQAGNHPRHQGRLCRHLIARDRKGNVVVRPLGERRRNEGRPRHHAKGIEQSLVGDPFQRDRLGEVLLRRPAPSVVARHGQQVMAGLPQRFAEPVEQ